MGLDTSGIIFYVSVDGTSWAFNTGIIGTVASNTWNHVAVTRSTSTFKVYLNGVQIGTNYTQAGALYSAGTLNYVGALNYAAIVSNPYRQMNGYISNVRIVKGTALYTAAFTPSTTPLTAVTNTSLLLNGINAGIVDYTMQNNYNTVGNVVVNSSIVKYGTGSMYFDGNGDYLTTLASQDFVIGSGDFTIEAWINPANVTGNKAIAGIFIAVSGGWYFGLSGSTLRFSSGFVDYDGTSSMVGNTWYHVACTKSSGLLRLFVNGSQVGTTTNVSAQNWAVKNPLYIGVLNNETTWYFNGYIDDLRITKGVARYTANFTPETQALLKN